MSTEVRICPTCAQTAVILVHDWKHTSMGQDIGQSTKEYRCQSCGVWYTRHARHKVIAWWIVGILLLPGCLFGLPFLIMAMRQRTFDRRVQVVEGAPVPPLRYPAGPPKRRCARCQGLAAAVKITRNTHNGIPQGTDYEYRCANCSHTFETESALGSIIGIIGAALCLGVAALFFIFATSAGWRFGGGIVSVLIGGVLGWATGEKLYNLKKYPAIEGTAESAVESRLSS